MARLRTFLRPHLAQHELPNRLLEVSKIRLSKVQIKVLCTAIWEFVPGRRHYIEIGSDLEAMYRKDAPDQSMLPRQISHFTDHDELVQYVVLWSDYDSNRYPTPPTIWKQTR